MRHERRKRGRQRGLRRGLCGFLDIERSVGAVMDAWDNEEVQSVEQLLEVDRRAREMACAQLGVAL